MNCTAYCKAKYYSDNKAEEILALVNEKLSKDICDIVPSMLCIFYDALDTTPCIYWDKAVFSQTFNSTEQLLADNPGKIVLSDDIVEHYLIGYHTYHQITEIINDLAQLNDSPEIKTRLYRIPTYISIVEGCLTNFFHAIALILNQTTTKDFASQNKLNQLCDLLILNGYELLAKEINVDIRNAINHGGVFFRKDAGSTIIEFQYTKAHKPYSLQMKTYEFDKLLEKVYDSASAVLLGLSGFINNHTSLLTINRQEKLFLPFSLLSMELSVPDIRCLNVNGLENNKQLNIDFYVKNTDRTYILQTASILAVIIYEHYNDYEQYMIAFSSERLATSWLRFKNSEIASLVSWTQKFDEVLMRIIERKDCLIWNPSTEDVDLQEVKYFRFPNFSRNSFKINQIK